MAKSKMQPGPVRRKLPDTRRSVTHKVVISAPDGQAYSVFITAGFYEDGTLAELFARVGKAGSTLNGLMDTIGVLTSYALQYGVPLHDLCGRMQKVSFEPSGKTSNEKIPECASIIDYIFSWLELEFGGKE